ncbi:hypothetical protein [Melittangium boletus]|uniref:hypothetical protein n=1 Tax=Melittangium boletus TaxID=83453 RepID=UPI003DA4F18D
MAGARATAAPSAGRSTPTSPAPTTRCTPRAGHVPARAASRPARARAPDTPTARAAPHNGSTGARKRHSRIQSPLEFHAKNTPHPAKSATSALRRGPAPPPSAPSTSPPSARPLKRRYVVKKPVRYSRAWKSQKRLA